MATRLAPLAARTLTIAELVDQARKGVIRVPRFQRGLRWEARDVRRLIESILNGYPIGSLLMWQRPADAGQLTLGATVIDAPKVDQALWVVDGQQRITSIVNVVSDAGAKEPRFALMFDLLDNQVRAPRPGRDDHAVPLPVIFDLRRVLAWFHEHPELNEYLEVAHEATTRLRQYPVSLSVVADADEADLRDIFDRTNNFGRRLTRAEIFVALNSSAPGGHLTYGQIAERIDAETRFGIIDDDTILRIILSRRGADVTREIRDEFSSVTRSRSEFPHETPDEAHAKAETAALSAVRFLQNEAHIPHFSILPYRYLLVVLARYLAHFPDPSPRQRVLLRRWVWRAAVLGPEIFKGSASGAIRALNNRITPGNESGSMTALLEAVRRPPFQAIDVDVFRTSNASTRLVLASMWSHGPRSLATGERYTTDDLAAGIGDLPTANAVAGTFVRRARLPAPLRRAAGNRYWALDPTEDALLDYATTPTSTLKVELREAVLASHLLDARSLAHLASGDEAACVRARTEAIRVVTEAFLTRMREPEHEDTPPLNTLVLEDDAPDDDDERDDA